MDIKIKKCAFLYSVPKLSLMRNFFDEVAFVGRSNTGKSSLINAVCQKDLARTSKTPGRTRHAVVYDVLLADGEAEKNIALVDLPGFGFASMSKTEAAECESLIFSYLRKRKQLSLLFVLLDIRRSLDEREQQIISIAKERNVEICLVLTKCDKLALAKRKPVMNKIAQDLALDTTSIMLHSTHDDTYARALRTILFNVSSLGCVPSSM